MKRLCLLLLLCGCPMVRDVHIEDLEDWDDDGFADVLYAGEDCDDTDPAIHPDAPDPPYDGVDSDCDGWSDYDADGDGFDAVDFGGEDCDDDDPAVHPDATDPSGDRVDQDCDGVE